MKFILIFCFYFITISLNSLNILFVSQNYENEEYFIKDSKKLIVEIINFNPISHYAEYINFYYIFTDKEVCPPNNFNNFDFYNKAFFDLLKSVNEDITLTIILINSNITRSKGGTVGDNDTPVIIITNSEKDRTILHEIGHALFKLGDEYEGEIQKLPSDIEIGCYKNLSLTFKNDEWDKIKMLIGEKTLINYEGGLYRKKGVYRAYKDCLMRNVDKELCPVCLYYAVKILNNLTGENKDFLYIYKNKVEKREFTLKKVSISSNNIF